jgi:hypothetical protein
MKTPRNFAFAALSVALTVFLSQTSSARLFAQHGASGGEHHTLRLKVNFVSFSSTSPSFDLTDYSVLAVGDEFTLGGTVAPFGKPDEVGSFGVQFVVTAPEGTELIAHGALNLPDGKISFQMLVGPSDSPDVHAAITGGTGAYLNAGGELIHHRRANGDEEFIFNFSTH